VKAARPARLAGAAAFAVAALTAARPAGAVEREQHVGVDAGGSLLVVSNHGTDVGAAFGGHYTYGLTDAFNLVAEAAWSPVAPGERPQGPGTPTTRPASVANADVGVAYVLDVLSWVPYGALLAGGYALAGGTIPDVRIMPGVAAGLGLDYRFGRSWAAGAAVRWHLLVTDPATYPTFMQLFARVEYTWGW